MNPINFKIQYLADREEFVSILGNWYYNEWGHENPKVTPEIETDRLRKTLNKSKIPLTMIATSGNIILGTGQLKWKEMSIYPDKEYWLGGILVNPEYRKIGVASQIVKHLIAKAKELRIEKLYLQTEQLDGGLYAQLGWEEIETIAAHGTKVLVMERNINS